MSLDGSLLPSLRGILAGLLVQEALRQNLDGRIRVHFNAELKGLDLKSRRASFGVRESAPLPAGASSSPGLKEVEATYDILIGADGSGSKSVSRRGGGGCPAEHSSLVSGYSSE